MNSKSGPVSPVQWTAADTEDVVCCVCDLAGEPQYRVEPFGVTKCPSCSLVYISPRLTSDALQRLYDDRTYFDGGVYGTEKKWDPAMILQRAWTSGRLKQIAKRKPAPARLLEVGSGYGLFLDAARKAGYQVSGVELSRTGAEHARTQLNLDIFCGQLEDTADDDPVDVFCAWDTLEHVPDPLSFLKQAAGRMADDGVFAFSTPYISSLPARLLGKKWWTLKPEQHIWHYTPMTLRLLTARAGLVIDSIITSPVRPSNVARLDSLVVIGHKLPTA